MLNRLTNICSRLSPLLGKIAGKEPYLDFKTLANDIVGGVRRHLANAESPARVLQVTDSFKLLKTARGDLLYWPDEYSHQIVDHVYNELTDPHWQDNYFRLWKPGENDVVFDLGACEGLFAYRIKDVVSKIHLFEPIPRIAAALRKTFENKILDGRAVVHECVVGEHEGTVAFHIDPENFGGSSIVETGKSVPSLQVRMTTIDRLVEELGIERLDLVKMDIEGAELQALRGAVQTMQRQKPDLLVCTYHRDDDIPTIPLFLEENSYKIVSYNCSYRQFRKPHYWPTIILAKHR
jgi:FkbM family methyltransferase